MSTAAKEYVRLRGSFYHPDSGFGVFGLLPLLSGTRLVFRYLHNLVPISFPFSDPQFLYSLSFSKEKKPKQFFWSIRPACTTARMLVNLEERERATHEVAFPVAAERAPLNFKME